MSIRAIVITVATLHPPGGGEGQEEEGSPGQQQASQRAGAGGVSGQVDI